MEYDVKNKNFRETEYQSLAYVRKMTFPYGFIKESGMPPEPHWDVILVTQKEYDLGDEAEIKIIGVFKRSDGDNKFVAVEKSSDIDDISELSEKNVEILKRFYPKIRENEGWFGQECAWKILRSGMKSL